MSIYSEILQIIQKNKNKQTKNIVRSKKYAIFVIQGVRKILKISD